MHESPGMYYQCYTTDDKNTQNPVTLHPWESLKYLNQFQCIPHILFHHIQFILSIVRKVPHFFHRNPWQGNPPPPPSQKRKSVGTKR